MSNFHKKLERLEDLGFKSAILFLAVGYGLKWFFTYLNPFNEQSTHIVRVVFLIVASLGIKLSSFLIYIFDYLFVGSIVVFLIRKFLENVPGKT